MKILLDTNILFDVLAQREPFYADSATVWTMVEQNECDGFISAISFNNVYYVMRRMTSQRKARKSLRILRDVFQIVSVDARVIHQAIDSRMPDFEDAIQYHSAIQVGVSLLISRNVRDFPRDDLPVLTPAEFLGLAQK